MKIKKNHLLTMAIMSLLGVNQSAMAAISSVMTLNGVTRTVEFASQAQLDGIVNATAPLADQLAFANLFSNPTPPSSSAGLVSTSNVCPDGGTTCANPVPVTLVNTSVAGTPTAGTFAVAIPQKDPATGLITTQFVTATKSGTGATAISATALAAEYVKVATTPGYTPDPALAAALATNVKLGATAAVVTEASKLINAAVAVAPAAPVVLPTTGAITDASIKTVTDPVALVQAQIQQELAKTAQTSAALVAATPTPAVIATPAGAISNVAVDPAIQVQSAQTQLAATKTVAATILAGTDTVAKAAVAAEQLVAAQAIVAAATAAGDTAAATAAGNEVTAAQTLVNNNPAFGAAAIAAQAAVATAQTALTTANTDYTTAVAALTPAQQADLAALQAGTLTGAAKAAAQKSLASLVPAVQAQVAAQNTLIAKQTAFVAALKADPNGAAALVTAQSDLGAPATATTPATGMYAALAGLKTVIAAIVPIDAAVVAAAAKVETDKVRSVFAAADVAGALDAETRLNAAAQAGDAALAAVEAQNLAGELAKIKTTQFQARNNSTSGIAGNPASNMNMTIDGAFNQVADFGGTSEASKANVSGASADIGGVSTSVGVGLQYGYYDIGGKSVNTVTMPLSVTAKFNPKHQLTLSVPLSYIQTQSQADAYQVGVTAAYKYNVSDNWSLTPSASYSYRSFDNSQNQYWNPNTSTSLVGGSITSKYTWNFSDVGVSLINMIGHYQTLDSEKNATANVNITGLGNFVGSSVSNNGIASYVVKNGLHATKMFGSFKLGAYFTDTEYFGTDLYFNQLNEFGFSLKPVNAGKMLDALSIDANYLFSIGGKHSSELDGFRLNLGYKF